MKVRYYFNNKRNKIYSLALTPILYFFFRRYLLFSMKIIIMIKSAIWDSVGLGLEVTGFWSSRIYRLICAQHTNTLITFEYVITIMIMNIIYNHNIIYDHNCPDIFGYTSFGPSVGKLLKKWSENFIYLLINFYFFFFETLPTNIS